MISARRFGDGSSSVSAEAKSRESFAILARSRSLTVMRPVSRRGGWAFEAFPRGGVVFRRGGDSADLPQIRPSPRGAKSGPERAEAALELTQHGLERLQLTENVLTHLIHPSVFVLRDPLIESFEEAARVDVLVARFGFKRLPDFVRFDGLPYLELMEIIEVAALQSLHHASQFLTGDLRQAVGRQTCRQSDVSVAPK